MTFDLNRLLPQGDNSKTGVCPNWYTYYNKDSDTVTASGYFKAGFLKAKDQITVVPAAGTSRANYYVSAVSGLLSPCGLHRASCLPLLCPPPGSAEHRPVSAPVWNRRRTV